MRRILLSLVSVFAALGLTFVATPASATTAASDDVGILAVVGTFNNGVPVINNQVCTPTPVGAVNFTFANPFAADMDERVAFFAATDPTCATPLGPVFNATLMAGGNLPDGTAFYSST